MKKVTILGAGNGGVTAAYHLSMMEKEICIYDAAPFDTQIKAINSKGGITAVDKLNDHSMNFPGFQKIHLATTDIKEAVDFSDIIIMICPSFAQELFFNSILPHLKDNHIIVLLPGNYGGMALAKIKNEQRPDLKIHFVDAITIPWACRIVSDAEIAIMGIKSFLPVSVFPKKDSENVKEKLENIFPVPLKFLPDPITAGLENINFGGHPLLSTLNMGLLENFNGEFNYYRDCCSIATAKAAAAMDIERLKVGNAYKLSLKSELDAMNDLYDSKYETVYDFNRGSATHAKIINSPNSSKSRYITEDVPYLLVPCYELAKLAGFKVPIIESCIHIAGAYNDEDYFATGRTIEKMGLSGKSLEDILTFLK